MDDLRKVMEISFIFITHYAKKKNSEKSVYSESHTGIHYIFTDYYLHEDIIPHSDPLYSRVVK